MDFSYVSTGGITLLGCSSPVTITYNLITAYSAGDFVWLKYRARLGVLERINIKKINVINFQKYNYQDTFNRLWLEYELCDLETAEDLVTIYKNKQTKAYAHYLKNCNTSI